MAAKNAPLNVGAETVIMLAKFLPLCETLGVRNLVMDTDRPYSYLDAETFIDAVNGLHPSVLVEPQSQGFSDRFFYCTFAMGGLNINAVLGSKALVRIGYTVDEDGRPVPLNQNASA